MKKRMFALAGVCVLCLGLLAGCQNKASYDVERYTSAGFAEAIQYARGANSEMNTMAPVEIGFPADDEFKSLTLGFNSTDVREMASAVSYVNTRAYGIVIVKPENGKAADVRDGLQRFVYNTRQSFENYLADQFAIAEDAILETLPDGSYILVMCEGAQEIYDSIVAYLNEEAVDVYTDETDVDADVS